MDAKRVRKLTAKAMANKTAADAAATKKAVAAAKASEAKKAGKTPAANTSVKMAPKAKAASKTKAAPKAATKAKAAPKAKSATPAAMPEPAAPKASTGANKRKSAEPAASASKKRKTAADADVSGEESGEEIVEKAAPASKKRKATPVVKEKAVSVAKKIKLGPAINEIPTQKLDVYVFGEGSSGELGLGSVKVDGKKPIDVKRPRLNENLSSKTVGVVQIAVGGMHSAALTFENKILTWGVNDQGALGRDTKWDGGLKDIDDASSETSDDDEDDTGMNPIESTPTAVEEKHFPEGTKFVQLAASDSATFALTEDGSVYGWGTFRSNEGILGFTEKIHIQNVPIKLPDLKKITSIAAGSNHVLALDNKGCVYAWGSGQQNQLGRRVVERTRLAGLVPRQFGLPKNKITSISCGAYHSFATSKDGKVWAWGLNNFGETGITDGAGDDNAVVLKPTLVSELNEYDIKEIKGGGHHSLACTVDGKLLVWGRADGSQMGIKVSDIPREHIIYDERGDARILKDPTVIPGIHAVSVSAGSDNSFAVDVDGKAYSWGFSANYQTGQGTDEDVELATLIDNTAVRGKKLNGAGAGGQFSILTAIPN